MASSDPPHAPPTHPHSQPPPTDLDYFLDTTTAPPLPTLPPQAPSSDMLMTQEILPVSTTTGGVPGVGAGLLPSAMTRNTHVTMQAAPGPGSTVGLEGHVLGGVVGNGGALQAEPPHLLHPQALPPHHSHAIPHHPPQVQSHPHVHSLPPHQHHPDAPNAAAMAVNEITRRKSMLDRSKSNVAEGGVQKRGRAVLNPEEKAAKDHKRILRNRELARVSNERRKGRIKAMETELQETKATVKRLQDSIKELEKENTGLRSLLEKH